MSSIHSCILFLNFVWHTKIEKLLANKILNENEKQNKGKNK